MASVAQPGSPIQSPPPGAPPYSPYPPYGPYGPPGPPYYPPPSKTSNIVLIVVIVVIVILLIPIVLAAVLYVLVSGILAGGPPPPPIVTFGQAAVSGGNVTFTVADVSQQAPIDLFRANLLVNTTAGTPRTVTAIFTINVGADSYTVTFTDSDQNRLLTRGDVFLINAGGGWRPGTSYQFMLLRTDSTVAGFRTWTA